MNIIIVCDGGCENNQDPLLRWAYGSFVVFGSDGESVSIRLREASRMAFGHLTNNEAEYLALINALTQLATKALTEPVTEIRIKSDSKLMINQVCGNWEINADHLVLYAKRVRDLLKPFKDGGTKIVFNYIPREQVVELLGH